jgi:hypothetical protein
MMWSFSTREKVVRHLILAAASMEQKGSSMKTIIQLGAVLLVVSALAKSVCAQSLGTVSLTLPTPSSDYAGVTTSAGANLGLVYLGPYPYTLSSPAFVPAEQAVETALGFNAQGTNTPMHTGFCIALTTDINANVQYNNFQVELAASDTTALSSAHLNSIIQLLNDYASEPSHPSLVTPGVGEYSDALSMAIWDVLNATSSGTLKIGTPGNLVAGNISVDTSGSNDPTRVAAAIGDANGWLAALNGSPASLPNDDYMFVLDGTNASSINQAAPVQNQSLVIVSSMGFSNSPVPEPKDARSLAGLGLLGLVAGGAVTFRRRRAVAVSTGN